MAKFVRSKVRNPKNKAAAQRIAGIMGKTPEEIFEYSAQVRILPTTMWDGMRFAHNQYGANQLAKVYGVSPEQILAEAKRTKGSAWSLWNRVQPFLAAGVAPPARKSLLQTSPKQIARMMRHALQEPNAAAEVRRRMGEERYSALQRYRQQFPKVARESDAGLLPILKGLEAEGVDVRAVPVQQLVRRREADLVHQYGSQRLLGGKRFAEVARLRAGSRGSRARDIAQTFALLKRLVAHNINPAKVSARELLYDEEGTLVRRYIQKLPAGEAVSLSSERRAGERKTLVGAAKPQVRRKRTGGRKGEAPPRRLVVEPFSVVQRDFDRSFDALARSLKLDLWRKPQEPILMPKSLDEIRRQGPRLNTLFHAKKALHELLIDVGLRTGPEGKKFVTLIMNADRVIEAEISFLVGIKNRLAVGEVLEKAFGLNKETT